MRKLRLHITIAFPVLLLLYSFDGCNKEQRDLAEHPPFTLAGGTTTSFVSDSTAYLQALSNISKVNLKKHREGEIIFNTRFFANGEGKSGGLGPLFIQDKCAGCHIGNGRSQPPLSEIDTTSGLLMRLSIAGIGPHGEPLGVPGYGTQLQTRAIPGQVPEGLLQFSFETFYETYPDGHKVLMHRPSHSILNPYTPLPKGVMYSLRNAPPLIGLGLLEAVPDAEILKRYEESDINGDNITGRPNRVWNAVTGDRSIGRFGWKGSTPLVIQQAADAFHGDMGITSSYFFPEETCLGQSNCKSGWGSSPDIDSATVAAVAFYVKTLAPPAPRNQDDPIVKRGKQLFMDINCSGCHTPELKTGPHEIPELSNQTIYPYTNMLLHEMGMELSDSRPDFEAGANEWLTTPLWGIGLTKIVNPNARFLHDGRAETIEEAILWHNGESYWITQAFKALPKEDRDAIIKFLESL